MHRKSAIAHTGLPFSCPHTLDEVRKITETLKLSPNSKIVDVGCGKGELLCMLTETFEASGLGVDSNTEILSKMRSVKKGMVKSVEMDLNNWIQESISNNRRFDLIFCIGSLTPGKQEETIDLLTQTLNEDGWLLIGDLVWTQKPSQHFLDFLQMNECAYCTSTSLIQSIESKHNYAIKYFSQVSVSDYETKLLENVEKWAMEHRDDPDCELILSKSRDWHVFSQEQAWPTWEFATILAQKGGIRC